MLSKTMIAPVWNGMDQAALDAEYTTRNQIGAGYDEWNAARRGNSEEARRRLKPTLDVPYGTGSRERLDVFPPPAGMTSAPIAIFFHGGFWKSGDKADLSLVAIGLRSLGAAVVLPNYPLCPAASIRGAVASAIHAVAWVAAHAREFGADGKSIWLCGHSSGAHLAASCCARLSRYPMDGVSDSVTAAILTSGMYELEPVRRSYLNKDANLSEVDVAELSPARADTFPQIPVLVAVGQDETPEFIRQSECLTSAIRFLGGRASFHLMDRTNHYTMLEQWSPGSELLTRFQLELAGHSTIGRIAVPGNPADCYRLCRSRVHLGSIDS